MPTGSLPRKNSDVISEFSMYFTKATQNKKWSMTASDTLLDLRDEAMSLELYKSFIDNIDTDRPVPKPFDALVTDSYWNGGTPYLSIAHYSDLEGEGIPGEVEVVYVDGNQLKAKGKFNETPLGLAAWNSVVEDKSKAEDERVRVSIAFIDLKHRHGNMVFERKSFEDMCPMCVEGAKNKVYLKGYLVHLAMTRKPVNPRSEVEVELSMGTITRKDDAASIVGEELATELSEKQKAMVGLSAVLVERADGDEPVEEVAQEEPKVNEEVVEPVADTVSTDEPVVEPVETPVPEPEVTPVVSESMGEMASISGPTSLKEMMDAKAAREEVYMIQDAWHMTEEVIYNILSSEAIKDKKKAITSVLGEFKSAMATKSLVDMFAEKSASGSPIDTRYAELSLVIKSTLEQNVTADEKLMAIQPALNELAATIQEEVRKPVAVEPNAETVSASVGVEEVVNKAIQPILEQMAMLMDMANKQAAVPTERRVPQPRAISPLSVKSLVATQKPRERTPIERIADQSVGLNFNE